MSVDNKQDGSAVKTKPKKKSLVERELESSLTEKFIVPVMNNDKCSTSRYGRARKLKTDNDFCESIKVLPNVLKSPTRNEKSATQQSSPIYRMYASNSPICKTTKNNDDHTFSNQIENIYNENIMMSRFSANCIDKTSSPIKSPKIYIRKDLIQRKEKEETITLIKNIFSPVKSTYTASNSHLDNYLERSSEKYNLNKSQNGHLDNNMMSVVKTLDFGGCKKRKKDGKDANKPELSKSDLFEMEAKCPYQVGDLVWARMGTYPFWPGIVTRDPDTSLFVKKKMFGRIERDVVNVTFFGDNGRHSWVVDNMLRKYQGKAEFLETRQKFSIEDKKKDPRFYAAFFVSEKKQALWNASVDEAETLLREPKRLRIDLFNEMLWQSRALKGNSKKSEKVVVRTDSDLSLSESLYDTLFSENDAKDESLDRSKKKTKNKSLDVSDVVTACLDNMAAKTGITKIQKQSHMDRWLQKAKSKTPEKNQLKVPTSKSSEKKSVTNKRKNSSDSSRIGRTSNDESRKSSSDRSRATSSDRSKKTSSAKKQRTRNSKRLSRKSQEKLVNSISSLENEHDYSSNFIDNIENQSLVINENNYVIEYVKENGETGSALGIISKIESLSDDIFDNSQSEQNELETSVVSDDLIDQETGNVNKPIDTEIKSLNSLNAKAEVAGFITNEIPNIINTSMECESELCESNNSASKVLSETFDNKLKNEKISASKDQDVPEKNVTDNENPITQTNTDDMNTSTETFCEAEIDECGNEINVINHQEITKMVEENANKIKVSKNKGVTHINKQPEIHPKVINGGVDYDSDSSKQSYSLLNRSFDSEKDIVEVTNTVSKIDKSENKVHSKNKLGLPADDMQESNNIKNTESNLTEPRNAQDILVINKSDLESQNYVTQDTSNENNTINTIKVDPIPNVDIQSNDKIPSDKLDKSTEKNEHKLQDNNSRTLLNLPHTELSITDGRITSSPFEFTNKDKLSKESSPERYDDIDSESINSENSEIPLSKLVRKKDNFDTASIKSNNSTSSVRSNRRNKHDKQTIDLDNIDVSKVLEEPDFKKYLELRQDQLLDENPELSEDEVIKYLYKTWIYEESSKSDKKMIDDFDGSSLVKGLGQDKPITKPKRKHNKLHNNVIFDSISVTSDESENISRRSLRSRTSSPFDNLMRSNTSSPADLISKDRIPKIVLTKMQDTNSFKNISAPKNIVPEVMSDDSGIKPVDVDPEIISVDSDVASNDPEVVSVDPEVVSIDSENSDIPLIQHKIHQNRAVVKSKPSENAVVRDDDDEISKTVEKRSKHLKKLNEAMGTPEFLKYLEMKQDTLIDEHPELTQDEIVYYLYKTWLYEEGSKAETNRIDELEHENLVKGLNTDVPPIKVKKKIKTENKIDKYLEPDNVPSKEKPKRKTVQPYYNEDLDDIENEIQYFEIFTKKPNNSMKEKNDSSDESKAVKEENVKNDTITPQIENIGEKSAISEAVTEPDQYDVYDEVEEYFQNLTKPKPNLFKGLSREKVCEVCENPGQLVKCKGCQGTFHPDCVKKVTEVIDVPGPSRGRKKKKKTRGRKPKTLDDSIESEGNSDEKPDLNNSEEIKDISMEETIEPLIADAENFEAQFEAKMKEIMDENKNPYEGYSANYAIDWTKSVAGNCEIVDITTIQIPTNEPEDYSEFKCSKCQKSDVPICFVCKSPVSPKNGIEERQNCQLQHCYKYYHLECLDLWPQTQFTGEVAKKKSEHFDAFTCPRHVCHTCVCDDPRGCKTRFSGDKLARCVRCPATYHTFTKCLPAGTQILTGSHIICPRHYEHRPGKVPCHVNTGWCFICALGGTLICCEYCPTSFHAECLNIKPPEGGYMCEDCETGRLPLYGEMVWVKLGHYRWWPGIILHPSEIPSNILAVRHSPGEFVVRFFGQYDHYWVNRGRVFPFQEGDSGRISSQKSKIDAAFTTAMEHAQRACTIMKNAQPNHEESDIASSLLPPHYIKLKVNKPIGSLSGKRIDVEESSLTQCDCDPREDEPCGPYSHCLNRMLLTECGPICKAGDRCQNRAFEKRQYPKMVPYRTPHRGWGLKTLEDIKMGQFVIEYVGELIDEDEFRRRMTKMHEIRDENFYFLTLDKERMIDAGPKGNLARFMNHCCEPNCETQKWTVLGDVRVGLFALYDIPAGSEVTFNYNLECAGIDKKKCMCGAKRCSGYIGAKPKQDESQSKKVKRVYKKRPKTVESPSTTKTKPKPRTTSRSRPKELTEIEKDLLIIKNATNGLSSDSESGRINSIECDKVPKPLKRKRVSFSTDNEVILINGDIAPPCVKRVKVDENDVGD